MRLPKDFYPASLWLLAVTIQLLQFVSSQECVDALPDCEDHITSWSQCEAAQEFFTKYCPKTCGYCACDDVLPDCSQFIKASSQCEPSATLFDKYCRRTCEMCGEKTTDRPDTSRPTPRTTPTTNPPNPPGPTGCRDRFSRCAEIVAADREFCKSNAKYMEQNCAQSCNFCGTPCEDLMPEYCASVLARADKGYCKSNDQFMRENCAKSCNYCDIDVTPPPSSDCVDKKKKCKLFAGYKDYCTYQEPYMRRNCPESCQFCNKEYNFAINTEWNGVKIKHAPVTLQISAQDSRSVRVVVNAPFFDDSGPPPCAVGSACDGLWNYEVAEVFFLGEKEKYLEVELGPHGQHLLLMLNGVRKPFLDKLPLKYEATIDRLKKTWTGTAIIPVDYFPPKVRKINAYAIHGSGENRVYESLYPAPVDAKAPDFHRLAFFKSFDFKSMFTMSWSKPLSLYWKDVKRRSRIASRRA